MKWIEVFVDTIVFGMGLVACHLLDLRDWDIFEVLHHLGVCVCKWQVAFRLLVVWLNLLLFWLQCEFLSLSVLALLHGVLSGIVIVVIIIA